MKRISLIMAVAFCALTIQACNNGAKTDSKEIADSTNKSKDTSATSSLATNNDDAKFAVEAASGGMEEVELGKLVQVKATDAQVKAFGSQMITDHTKANNELMALAKSKNITLPSTPGDDAKKVMTDLDKKSGKDFDKAYVDAMVDDHKKDVSKFEDASKNLKDSDLKAFAAKTLPVLKMHLDMITKIHDSMK